VEKSMKTPSNPHIRAIEPKDFSFIRSLAAEFPTFTVPSEYLLWFLTRFHPDYCQVLEQKSGGLRGYFLAMPTSNPRNGIAIWQVASTKPSHAFALEYFTAYLRDLVELTGATSISFTTQQEPAASMRLIRTLAKQFFDCDAIQQDSVPTGQGEYEFRLSIDTVLSENESEKKTGGTG
jgi:hypothetical protein